MMYWLSNNMKVRAKNYLREKNCSIILSICLVLSNCIMNHFVSSAGEIPKHASNIDQNHNFLSFPDKSPLAIAEI